MCVRVCVIHSHLAGKFLFVSFGGLRVRLLSRDGAGIVGSDFCEAVEIVSQGGLWLAHEPRWLFSG